MVVASIAALLVVSATATSAAVSPKAAFNAKVRAVGTQAQKALLAMPAQASPTPEQAAASAAELQVIYARVAKRLAALTPPKPIKADFKLLVISYQVAAKNAGLWHDAILNGTPQQAAAASRAVHLDPSYYRGSAALVRMSERGYYFGTFFR